MTVIVKKPSVIAWLSGSSQKSLQSIDITGVCKVHKVVWRDCREAWGRQGIGCELVVFGDVKNACTTCYDQSVSSKTNVISSRTLSKLSLLFSCHISVRKLMFLCRSIIALCFVIVRQLCSRHVQHVLEWCGHYSSEVQVLISSERVVTTTTK